MFEITVEREFCAAHSIRIGNRDEPLHGHNWRVRATVVGDALDENDLLIDFHLLERWLDEIIRPFDNASFNETPPFNETNPTAERIVEYIGKRLSARLSKAVALAEISVTEAPGCVATWRPGDGRAPA